MAETTINLLELQQQIRFALEDKLDTHYWVVAEISELNVTYKGHCYLSLIQKDEKHDRILARARGIIWAMKYRMLSAYFESQSKERLKAGLKVLIKVRVDYHEQYGLSLQIGDIDPTYTLGDVEKRRKEIIARLENAGITEMNKTLDLPLVIRKIAVISSDTAAGFGDFVAQMESNSYHYAFQIQLFRAAMQGEDTENTVITALESIYEAGSEFDLVVIIRGGGAKTDLSWFDNYEIASHVAQFPIPVFSGIGHERDASVTDMVAHTHLKTPTAVAEAIISHNRGFEESLDTELENLLSGLRQYLNTKNDGLNRLSRQFTPAVKSHLNQQNQKLEFLNTRLQRADHSFIRNKHQQVNQLIYTLSTANTFSLHQEIKACDNLEQKLRQSLSHAFVREQHKLERLADKLHANDPARLLEKGFSLTSKDGKPVTSAKELRKGNTIKTRFKDGSIESEVK